MSLREEGGAGGRGGFVPTPLGGKRNVTDGKYIESLLCYLFGVVFETQ